MCPRSCDVLSCFLRVMVSGDATPEHARANGLAEIPLPWLLPWQSKVVIIKLYMKIF